MSLFLGARLAYAALPLDVFARTIWDGDRARVTVNRRLREIPGVVNHQAANPTSASRRSRPGATHRWRKIMRPLLLAGQAGGNPSARPGASSARVSPHSTPAALP